MYAYTCIHVRTIRTYVLYVRTLTYCLLYLYRIVSFASRLPTIVFTLFALSSFYSLALRWCLRVVTGFYHPLVTKICRKIFPPIFSCSEPERANRTEYIVRPISSRLFLQPPFWLGADISSTCRHARLLPLGPRTYLPYIIIYVGPTCTCVRTVVPHLCAVDRCSTHQF